jgi:Flp pilus assembly protein TadG
MSPVIRKNLKTQTARLRSYNPQRLLHCLRREDGSQLVEMTLILPVLFLLLAGTVDFGQLYFVAMEVSSAAEAGASYGLQNPSDIAGMQAAALLNAQDLSGLRPVATYGTECSDGTSAVALNGTPPTCAVTTVQYVEVDTTATYKPILAYPGIQSLFTVTGKSRMRTSR